MSDEPPSVKRPDWNAATIGEPEANVSGSTCVLCWLVPFVNGSELIRTSDVAASAAAAPIAAAATARTKTRRRLRPPTALGCTAPPPGRFPGALRTAPPDASARPLQAEARARNRALLEPRRLPVEPWRVHHEVQVVQRAREERVRLAGLDDQDVALGQLDRRLLDAHARRSSRDEVDLRHLRVDVRLVDALGREADGHVQAAVPRPGEPALRLRPGPLVPQRDSSGGRAPERVPGEHDVVLGRSFVADGEPQRVAPVQSRVRDEDLAAPVHALEQRSVLLVGSGCPAEADHGERPRRNDLPAGLLAHPPLEQLREPHRLADPRLQPLASEAAEHRPQLQRPEAPPERRPVLAEAERVLLVRRP